LFTSRARSTQALPQPVWPIGQQIALLHCCPWPQTVPQVPQFFGSLDRSAQTLLLQQTLPGSQQGAFTLPGQQACVLAQQIPLQGCWPGIEQVPWPHFPAEQVRPEGQRIPQPPQLFGSAAGLVQTPLQQVRWIGCPVGPGKVQELPQAPQLFASVCVSTATQAPLEQHWPPGQPCPLLPQAQLPFTQLSPLGQQTPPQQIRLLAPQSCSLLPQAQ
jgi:hypothetical protein